MPHYNITEAQFFTMFQFVPNHFDSNVAHDGCMFETYGQEYEFVRQQDPRCVWTVLEDFNGRGAFASGYRHCNRLGYLISTKPRECADDDYWIYYDERDDEDDAIWSWEEAFDKFGFGDGDGVVMTETVADALRASGFTVTVESWGMHNVVITAIARDGVEHIPDSASLGYDDPRDYLPIAIIQLLDNAF